MVGSGDQRKSIDNVNLEWANKSTRVMHRLA